MYEFKGYGWSELAEAWGVPYNEDENRYLDAVRDCVCKCMSDTAMYSDLRRFVTALHAESEKIDHFHPLWKGLLEVQDSNTFVQACLLLLPTMWT